jgi:predicted transcriptional regulator
MKRDTERLSARQRLALPVIAAEPTIERAAERVGVTRKTVYKWLKQEPTRLVLRYLSTLIAFSTRCLQGVYTEKSRNNN